MPARPTRHLLLVDDSPADADLLTMMLRTDELGYAAHVVDDGVRALQFLRKEAEFADAPPPDLIVLDLHLPRLSGREVIQAIRADEAMCHLPIVVMSTSDRRGDVDDCYRLGANAYLAKPADLFEFRDAIKTLEDFFFSTIVLPG